MEKEDEANLTNVNMTFYIWTSRNYVDGFKAESSHYQCFVVIWSSTVKPAMLIIYNAVKIDVLNMFTQLLNCDNVPH